MGQYLRVNGDYNIQAGEGGHITLDTGPGVGNVIVTGNFTVLGSQVNVEASNLDIVDNIITLNKGEPGPGVTLRYSGITVDRGTINGTPTVSMIWNEQAIPADPTPIGAWEFVGSESYDPSDNSRIIVKEIWTSPENGSGGDLLLIGSGTGVLTVAGTTHYEDQITDDDDIPNKKYVDLAIQNNPTFQVVSNDSRLIVSDKDQSGSLSYFTTTTGYTTYGESAISLVIDGTLNSQFYKNRVLLQGLEFSGNEITNNDTNANVFLRTQGTGKVQTNYAVQLEKIAVTPAFVSNSTLVYAATPGLGTTGLYFVNDSSETIKRTGELISKNKALVFSMLF